MLDNPCRRIVDIVKVNWRDAVTLTGELQPIIVMVDHKDLFRADQAGAGGAEQPHRTRAENRHAGAFIQTGVLHRLPGGRQDIGQEQHFIVR